jgi:hypothetical protein
MAVECLLFWLPSLVFSNQPVDAAVPYRQISWCQHLSLGVLPHATGYFHSLEILFGV